MTQCIFCLSGTSEEHPTEPKDLSDLITLAHPSSHIQICDDGFDKLSYVTLCASCFQLKRETQQLTAQLEQIRNDLRDKMKQIRSLLYDVPEPEGQQALHGEICTQFQSFRNFLRRLSVDENEMNIDVKMEFEGTQTEDIEETELLPFNEERIVADIDDPLLIKEEDLDETNYDFEDFSECMYPDTTDTSPFPIPRARGSKRLLQPLIITPLAKRQKKSGPSTAKRKPKRKIAKSNVSKIEKKTVSVVLERLDLNNLKNKNQPKATEPERKSTRLQLTPKVTNIQEDRKRKQIIVPKSEIPDAEKEVEFKCPKCNKRFATESAVERHRVHYHKDRYPCAFCDKTFLRRQEQVTHQMNHNKRLRNACPICNKKFDFYSRVAIHMIRAHETDDKPHSCTTCPKKFTLEQNLTRHIDLHKYDKVRPFPCDICDIRWKTEEELEQHNMKRHANLKKYKCPHCDKGFCLPGLLNRHIRTHTGEKPFKCDLCEERFIDMPAKLYHKEKVHATPDEHHLCPHCGKKFVCKSILYTHVRVVHEKFSGNIKCDKCDAKFKDRKSLQSHKIRVHGEQLIRCEECDAEFYTTSGLRFHQKSNHSSAEAPHKCPHCEKAFFKRDLLTDHMSVHTNERPFGCDICGPDIAFKTKKHLRQHKKSVHATDHEINSRVRKHACSICGNGKAFRYNSELQAHIRMVHKKERPHVCEFCGRGFALNNHFRQHLRNEHGVDNKNKNILQVQRKRKVKDVPTTSTTSTDLLSSTKPVEDNVFPNLGYSKCSLKLE